MDSLYYLFKRVNFKLLSWVTFKLSYTAYHTTFNDFKDKFPNEKPIVEKYTAIEDGQISEELINKLKMDSEAQQEIKDIFKKFRLNVSFLQFILNKGPVETWEYIINENDCYIWGLLGDEKNLKFGSKVVNSSKDVLCDISSLLTIQYLDLLDEFKDNYNLFVYQRDFNSAFEEYNKTKLINENGLKTLSYENGKIVMTEVSSEYIEPSLKRRKTFIEWLNNNCKKIGELITDNHVLDKDIFNFIESPIKLCSENNMSMFIDGFIIREYANYQFQVDTFNTIDILDMFLSKHIINEQKYNESIGKLMIIGYYIIPVKKEVFMYYFQKNDFEINNEIKQLFDYLKHNDFNLDYLIKFSSNLLQDIWSINIPDQKREQITDKLCYCLSFKNNKKEVIKKLIIAIDKTFHPFLPLQKNKVIRCIKQWLNGQTII